MSSLPFFPYHPNAIANGSISPSSKTCDVCKEAKGYVYTGPFLVDKPPSLCPWCIADESAYIRFGAVMINNVNIGGVISGKASGESYAAIFARTPGYNGGQKDWWPACCGEATAYLGPAEQEEIVTRFPEAIAKLREYDRVVEGIDGDGWEYEFALLDRDGVSVAHIFQCIYCGEHSGYIDREYCNWPKD